MFKIDLPGTLRLLCATGLLATSAAFAAEVKVEGVHLCCGKCVKAATQALTGVNGVSQVNVVQDDETVTFQAANPAAAQRGLKALAASGLYGEPSVPGPDFKTDADKTANEIHISKLHLCCGGCVKAAEAAVKGLPNVKSVSTQSKQGTMTVNGENIHYAALLKALHESGMHGQLR